MKILLVNHEKAGDWGGGDSVQIKETGKRLKQRGHLVDIVNSDEPSTNNYDIVHIFNCRIEESLERQIKQCKISDVPIAISPIWVSIGKAIWGSRGTVGVLQKGMDEGEESIRNLLDQLKRRRLAVEMAEGTVLNSQGDDDKGIYKMARIGELLKEANGLLPNSWLELQAIRSDHQWSGRNFSVAHYGVDPRLFLDTSPKLFIEKTGMNQPFVLQAGRIEPAKNQAMLCWAMRNKNIPVVLIGKKNHWPSYAQLCKDILGSRLTIIDHMSQEELASAYAAAKVHILPSWMETCGLVTLEAALAGTPVIGSIFGHELEYLQEDAWYVDPADPETIELAIMEAWEQGSNNKKTTRLKRRILEKYNWERTTDTTEDLYTKIINGIA